MKHNIYFFLLILIFLLGFFLRFYKLGEIPYGFYQDESAIGYNAFSIMQTGHDEHSQSFPLYFKSFGDYKLPIYIYLSIPAIKAFGLTEFAIRFPSMLFGFLTLIVFYFFTRALTRNNNLALIAAGLLAINPWHLHYSRATFEVSISLFLFTLGGLFLYKALEEGKRGLFLIGTLCFIVDIYTYNLTRLLAPLLFALFIFTNRKKIKIVSKLELIATIITTVVILIPFITTFLQSGGLSSSRGTLIFTSSAVQAPLLELRSYFVNFPVIFTKAFFNQLALTAWQYINNVASFLSPAFFFISGSSHGNHGIGNVGQFYLFELPLVVFGVIKTIKDKKKWGNLLLLWAVVVILIASLTREVPHATRSFFLIVPLEIFSALGLVILLQKIKKYNYYRLLVILALGFVLYNVIFYFSSYYIRFPILYAKAWRQEDKALSLYLLQNQNNYDKIIFDKESGFVYTSLLFYQHFSPQKFQESAVYYPDDSEGMSQIQSFDKYEFRNIDWEKDISLKNTLIITNADHKPKDKTILKTFTYPARPIVIAKKQEILQYPVEEIAYVIVETK